MSGNRYYCPSSSASTPQSTQDAQLGPRTQSGCSMGTSSSTTHTAVRREHTMGGVTRSAVQLPAHASYSSDNSTPPNLSSVSTFSARAAPMTSPPDYVHYPHSPIASQLPTAPDSYYYPASVPALNVPIAYAAQTQALFAPPTLPRAPVLSVSAPGGLPSADSLRRSISESATYPAPASSPHTPTHTPVIYNTPSSATTHSMPSRVHCPLCNRSYGRQQELDRHMRSNHADSEPFACCGVPLALAQSRYGLSEGDIATSTRKRYRNIEMVGGCWESTFNRRDSYKRHLDHTGCIGDQYGEWFPGNQRGVDRGGAR
ncbi:hypothetical protein C8Q76DRAFT_717040 [Earliella scabrosa]|nr:hypothetical protein C8Q76DRAFT_717040 [Earliella scabrosa]